MDLITRHINSWVCDVQEDCMVACLLVAKLEDPHNSW